MRVSRAWEGQGVDWSDSDYLRLDWGVISIRTCPFHHFVDRAANQACPVCPMRHGEQKISDSLASGLE